MKQPCATTILAVLCVLTSLIGWMGDTEEIFSEFGYSTENLLAGKIYVIFTSIFLHSNLDHLLSNILVLLIFGLALEKELGCHRLLWVFFGGAILGDLISSLSFIYSTSQIAVGASAGVFSVIAATMILKPVQMEYYFPIPLGVIALGYLVYAIIGLISNYPPYVAHIAHIGGAIFGLCYGCRKVGLQRTFKVLMAVTILLLFVPLIWNIWIFLINLIV